MTRRVRVHVEFNEVVSSRLSAWAAQLGVDEATAVHRLVVAATIPSADETAPRSNLTEDDAERVRRMYERGSTDTAIMSALELTSRQVRAWRRARDLPPHGAGRPTTTTGRKS